MNHDTDPIAILEQLDPEDLRTRLDQLDRQRSAILVLLRAARARQRKLSRREHQQSAKMVSDELGVCGDAAPYSTEA